MISTILLYVLICLSVSFFCSLLEAVFLSISPAYILLEIKNGRRYGRVLEKLKERVDRPLAAILTLNTIANTLGAAGVGAEVQRTYGDKYLTAASVALTLVILIFAEILPKSLGASNWKLLAPFAAVAIQFLLYVAYPFVMLSEGMNKILRHETDSDSTMTREEMIVTAEMSASEGEIKQKESAIIRNLLMLDQIKVQEIMTPRSVMLAFEEDLTVGDIMERHKPLRFSRIPIYHNDLDHVTGLLHRYKILEAASNDQDKVNLKNLAIPIHTVPESVSVSAAIDQFIKRKEHLFLVVDDYGSTEGIVTLEDAIETLLGVEIVDEFDTVVDMRELALQKWRERKQQTKIVPENS